jgi:hypothetical protein
LGLLIYEFTAWLKINELPDFELVLGHGGEPSSYSR